jgi:hypothetical protein
MKLPAFKPNSRQFELPLRTHNGLKTAKGGLFCSGINIEPAAILFHSGYLTINRRVHVETKSQDDLIVEEAFI